MLLTKSREFFNTRHSIAIEDTPNTLEWVLPSHCVWDGPEFLTVKVPLRYYYGGESELETFFRNLLEIQDSSQADILEELDHMRELGQIGNRSISEASRVYRFLEETAQTGADRRSLRYAYIWQETAYINRELQECFQPEAVSNGRWRTMANPTILSMEQPLLTYGLPEPLQNLPWPGELLRQLPQRSKCQSDYASQRA